MNKLHKRKGIKKTEKEKSLIYTNMNKQILSQEEWLESLLFRVPLANEYWDLSKAVYKGVTVKVTLGCRRCGHYWDVQPPTLKLASKSSTRGCPNCSKLYRKTTRGIKREKFIPTKEYMNELSKTQREKITHIEQIWKIWKNTAVCNVY